MTWVAVAVGVGGAVVGAYGANQSAGAAKDAAGAQGAAANQANQIQLQMFNQQRQDQQPFRQAGLVGLNEYMAMLGLQAPASLNNAVNGPPAFTPEAAQAYLAANPDVAADPYWGKNPWLHYTQNGAGEGRTWGTPAQAGQAQSPQTTQQSMQSAFDRFRATPGYQFGLDQGFKTVQASAAARSGLNSGATLKALQKFGNDYADQQGFTPYMNRLSNLFGGAQTATNQMGQAGQNYANQAGANLQAAGQARASGIVGAQNAWNNFYGQAANTAGQLAGYYMGQR